jgi:hypothetical protein
MGEIQWGGGIILIDTRRCTLIPPPSAGGSWSCGVLGWIERIPAPACPRRRDRRTWRRKLSIRRGLRFGRFAPSLGRFSRRTAGAPFVEAEIDVLLELLELFFEFAGFKLHLFDLPVDLPNLAFEPVDPDEELRSLRLFPGIRGIPGLTNVSRGTLISLREANLVSDRAVFVARAKILRTKILDAQEEWRSYKSPPHGDKRQNGNSENPRHYRQQCFRQNHG